MVVITGGTAKGRKLNPPLIKGLRPTSAKAREAFFSMIGQDLSGMAFWDAFGGSGIMGFEAASRGAEPVLITESSLQAMRAIQTASLQLGLHIQTKKALISNTTKLGLFDIVFFDPPYRYDPIDWVDIGFRHASDTFVFETTANFEPPLAPEGWRCDQIKRYGQSQLVIYRFEGEGR